MDFQGITEILTNDSRPGQLGLIKGFSRTAATAQADAALDTLLFIDNIEDPRRMLFVSFKVHDAAQYGAIVLALSTADTFLEIDSQAYPPAASRCSI
jgi:hypothetical protein